MSYSNGLGNLQQLLGNLATNASRNSTATNQPSASTTTNSIKPATNAGSVDQAKLSSASGVVSQTISGSDVRLGKVAALQQTIADGTYNVPASDVASSIIASLLG